MDTRKTITIDGDMIELDDEFLSHVLQTAVEGGCSYWADVNTKSAGNLEGNADGPDGAGDFDVSDYTSESGEESGDENGDAPFYTAVSFLVSKDPSQGGTLDLQGIADALERIISGEVEIAPAIREIIIAAVREEDASEIDAEAADCIVQIGLFDEIVFS